MSLERRIVLATHNPGKVRELAAILGDLGLRVESLAGHPEVPEVVEDGATFLENALKKARTVASATGCLALADDSGLVVDALGGAPGVHSARYAGEDADDDANNRKLLAELAGVPEAARTARFVCVVAVADPSGAWTSAEGTCEGRIAPAPAGSGGFGYDPVFYVPELGATMAEVPPEVKNRISHRAAALATLKPRLEAFLREGAEG
ncbi:XTP/dITP diphosphatase [Dissulfurirhabdus thermomarina]|uniref:dITP/XTP pyrophosphatase n=1 Tax=Dissulfurirhabdus thermomarina TaxID=1765737 RepID=A0A6N9TQI8_DISTH|nr:XTP/dITP diphosphatase [Dissulfurirhabdus thermomarina]NDY41707.1 XTP/dITP diphosphatase [Dissulfurirhabdus thermomarina]NMX23192.1 XTP/dITP diphosphatase [Dissulfurirhabdus thermomarina]